MDILTERSFDKNRFEVKTLVFSKELFLREFIRKDNADWQIAVSATDIVLTTTHDTRTHLTKYLCLIIQFDGSLKPCSDAMYDHHWKYINMHYPLILKWLKSRVVESCPLGNIDRKPLPVSTWDLTAGVADRYQQLDQSL